MSCGMSSFSEYYGDLASCYPWTISLCHLFRIVWTFPVNPIWFIYFCTLLHIFLKQLLRFLRPPPCHIVLGSDFVIATLDCTVHHLKILNQCHCCQFVSYWCICCLPFFNLNFWDSCCCYILPCTYCSVFWYFLLNFNFTWQTTYILNVLDFFFSVQPWVLCFKLFYGQDRP